VQLEAKVHRNLTNEKQEVSFSGKILLMEMIQDKMVGRIVKDFGSIVNGLELDESILVVSENPIS